MRPHGAVQQLAVVGDDQHRVGVFDQVVFQPECAFEIEVVGRLVQQQIVGLREEDGGEGHAHPPAAREGGAGHELFGGIKTKAAQDRGGAGLGGPGVDIGEAGLHLTDAGGVGGGFGLGQQLGAFGIGGEHRVEERDLVAGHLLRDAADAGAGGQGDGAAFQRQLAPDQLEERGFARAIAADQAHLVACRDGGGGGLEKRAALDIEGQVCDA